MDLKINFLIERATNEILAAESLKKISENPEEKENLNIPENTTFYSSVISHAYYAIFYCAKAYLASLKITLPSEQGQHQQVYHKFKQLVNNGSLEKELLNIYEGIRIKAEELLEILWNEKIKRNTYTYKTLPQANKEPANDSLNNAKIFISHIKALL